MRRRKSLIIYFVLCALLAVPFATATAAEEGQKAGEQVQTYAQTAESLGLLVGEGQGVTKAYLAKKSTRIQAALISLRLQGKLAEAHAYKGSRTFADANLAGKSNQPVLAYLKDHPQAGWSGSGGAKFDPLSPISSQQLYKAILEAIGYKAGGDFQYKDTESFAAGKGLVQISGTAALTNSHIATALIEALSATTAHGHSLLDMLKAEGVIKDTALASSEQIALRSNEKLGTYFTDGKGRALYLFTKDAQDLNACTGSCMENWPVLTSEHLQIPTSLNAADFTTLTRKDGTKQWMYKGWPLYYFIKDSKPGDVQGEAVADVWFIAKPDYSVMLGTNSVLGHYLTDSMGRTLYYFDNDAPQTSGCEGQCLVNWPAYSIAGGSVPSTLSKADFGSIKRVDGTTQATYKGYPLYTFIADKAHGDTNGQEVNNVWFVINPAKFTGTTAGKAAASATPTAKTYRVDIKDFSFGSGPLTVEAGSTIIFTNLDDMKHNAVAKDGSFAIPLISKGESASIKLDKPGTYNYFCEPHKNFMTGQIIVK
ncbi:plastocyanin/azurin family copper-binding protein [Paenibacillus sp. KS-LC4]|uniref:plastocyanin/azurin family copper-binding protein n=1 Tax=Paenibacillus sp. KS-LC4 TaxID=2979727 RepID=UPI0030CCB849